MGSFSGSLQDFSKMADEDDDMASEYGLDKGEEPDSPIHPSNDFLSQVARPGSMPVIISTACMASLPLPDFCSASHTSSTNTIRDARDSSKPYAKLSLLPKSCSKPSSSAPLQSASPVPPKLPILAADWAHFSELLNNWHDQSKLYHESFQYKDLHPFPPDTANEAAFYYTNIGRINQEVASVHLASGVWGHFISAAGCSKVEQQLSLLGGGLDADVFFFFF